MNKNLVIIMGANYTSRLGMIRAIGRTGCDVAVVITDKQSPRRKNPPDVYSKYINRGIYWAPQPDGEALIKVLLKEFSYYRPKPVLIPTNDFTAAIIDLNVQRLMDYFIFPSVRYEQGKTVYYMNKIVQKELAVAAGFNVAEHWVLKWTPSGYEIPNSIKYPCFIKPAISYSDANKYNMRKCINKEQLKEAVGRIKGNEEYPLLVEEFIEIEEEYDIPGLALQESVILPGLITKEEVFQGLTGTGVIQSIDNQAELKKKLTDFVKKLGFTGLIDIELFKSGGKIYFNELNLRYGASGFAMTGSGINLPKMLIQIMNGEKTDGTISIVSPKYFASEKVCLQKVANKVMSWNTYYKILKNTDFNFIQNDDDVKPYYRFRKLVVKQWLKTIVEFF